MVQVAVIILLIVTTLVLSWVQEAADGSVCFSNCNGHGTCLDYTCTCYPGFSGDDCSISLTRGDRIVPILTAGNFNLTNKNFTKGINRNKLILVGFSARSCQKCITVEPEYEDLSKLLFDLKLPFARVDADSMKSIALQYEASELPTLVLFKNSRSIPYHGVHNKEAVVTFIEKQMMKIPLVPLDTVNDVENFIASRNSSKYSISTVMVIGFFSEHEDVEEDDYEDFVSIAKEFQVKEDIFFGIVTNAKTSGWFKNNKTIDRTPSILLIGEQVSLDHIMLHNIVSVCQ